MPDLLRAPLRTYRTWAMDSRRWTHYVARGDDIIIATYPKCGTTWTQRLVSMLVFQSPEPRSIHDVSLWPDARFRGPIEDMIARLDAQEHRRFIKSHVPLDGMPLYGDVKYIHVARDGRDACMSWLNHQRAYTTQILATFDRIGLEDETLGRPIPRPSTDPRQFFRDWLEHSERDALRFDFFDFEMSYWSERQRQNLLLVHYNDLQADLAAEMRRIGAFLEIDIPEALWPDLVEAGGFEAMRRDGQQLLPRAGDAFDGGSDRFLFKGSNGRWKDVLTADDLAAYAARVTATLPPGCARWLEGGRLVAGDPRSL